MTGKKYEHVKKWIPGKPYPEVTIGSIYEKPDRAQYIIGAFALIGMILTASLVISIIIQLCIKIFS